MEEVPRLIEKVEVQNLVRIGVGEDGKQFVEYECVYTTKDGVFSLWFRYSVLRELDAGLRKRFKRESFPSFPGRGIFRSELDKDFIEERRNELDAYLREMVPRFFGKDEVFTSFFKAARYCGAREPDFAVPTDFNGLIPPVVMLGEEEVWLGAVLDGSLDAIRFLHALRQKVLEHKTIDQKLGLLEVNGTRTSASCETLRNNMPVIARVCAAPLVPQNLRDYLAVVNEASRNALEYASVAESNILSSLSSSESPAASALPVVAERHVEEQKRIPIHEALEQMRATVESLRVDMISLDGTPESMKRLELEKKQALEFMSQRRELEKKDNNNPDAVEQISDLIRFVEEYIVASPSLHDTVIRLESKLFGLIDCRAQLHLSDKKGATVLRRDLIALRRMLRDVKAEWMKDSNNGDDDSDPAEAAAMNRLTDLQENASQLQIDLEQNFEYDQDVEDLVMNKIKDKVLREAAKEHEQVENDLFSL